MGNEGFGERRCKQIRKDSKDLQQLRLKTPLFATDDGALTDKRDGEVAWGGDCNTGTPGLAVRVFHLWGCSLHEWL